MDPQGQKETEHLCCFPIALGGCFRKSSPATQSVRCDHGLVETIRVVCVVRSKLTVWPGLAASLYHWGRDDNTLPIVGLFQMVPTHRQRVPRLSDPTLLEVH